MEYGASGSTNQDDKEDLGGNVESVHEDREYEDPSTFVGNNVEEEESQTISESDDRNECGIADENVAVNSSDEHLVERENHPSEERVASDTFMIDETSGKIAITSPSDENDIGDQGANIDNEAPDDQETGEAVMHYSDDIEDGNEAEMAEAEQMMKEINYESKMREEHEDEDGMNGDEDGQNNGIEEDAENFVNGGIDAYESKVMEVEDDDDVVIEDKEEEHDSREEVMEDTLRNSTEDDTATVEQKNDAHIEDEKESKVQEEIQSDRDVQENDFDEEPTNEEENAEKEESEPGSPQYDDTKRKSVPLVPEEMKVNKSSATENTITENNDDAPRPLSREDIRNARLAALEKRMAASKADDNEGIEDSNVESSDGKK